MLRSALGWLVTSLPLVGCTVREVELEGKLCPCADGYTCIEGRCTRHPPPDAAQADAASTCPLAPVSGPGQQLSCSANHTCVVQRGQLWCWGDNRRGQLGLGHQQEAVGPQRVGTHQDWTSVSAGDLHTCAIRDQDGFGALHCWGGNDDGQLGLGDVEPRTSPLLVTENISYAQVACGQMHSCALQSDGLLWCWGRQEGGAVGLGVIGPPLTVPARVGTSDVFVQLTAGLGHNCALREDARLWCWGHFECWQIGSRQHELIPEQVDAGCWARAAAGGAHSCAIDDQAELYCFGSNEEGQLGIGFVDGGETSTLDGCNAFDVPQPVPGGLSWATVATGRLHTCAITTEGQLYCWGFNEQRQATQSQNLQEPAPVRWGSASDWVEVCAGFFHSCALNGAGEVYCVGSNEYGQQGTGDWNEQLTRVPL